MNVELAMAALEDAKAHPENFDMASYFGSRGGGAADFVKEAADMTVPPCGTTGCFAGFVALRVAPVGARIAQGRIIHPDGPLGPLPGVTASDYARRALEITSSQAITLFNFLNIEQVEAAVHYLADSPDTDGDDLWDMFMGTGE
jgi:hypothetical protein